MVARASASLEAALVAGMHSPAVLQSLGDALESSIKTVERAWAERAA
jgi:hypothetical protein